MDEFHVAQAPPRGYEPVAPAPRLERAIRIRMYRNGDGFYAGRNILIPKNPGQANFDVFLDQVTEGLRPSFGAVRAIFEVPAAALGSATAATDESSWTRVQSLSQFVDGRSYVACGHQAVVPINYTGIPVTQRRAQPPPQQPPAATARASRIVRSARYSKLAKLHPIAFTLFKNGDPHSPATKLLLMPNRMGTLEQFMEFLSERVGAPVRCLFTLTGEPVDSANVLKTGGSFVYASQPKFRKIFYGDGSAAVPRQAVTLNKKRALPPIPKAVKRRYSAPPPSFEALSLGATTAPASTPRMLPQPPSAKRQPHPPAAPEDSEEDSPSPVPAKPTTPAAQVVKSGGRSFRVADTKSPASRAPADIPKVQTYNLTVVTGDLPNAGTDAKVYVTLLGSSGASGRRLISESADNFKQGAVDVLAIEAAPLGTVNRVVVEHDNSGASSAWFLESIAVRDTVTNTRVLFPCARWLADDRGDFVTRVELVPGPSKPAAAAVTAVAADADFMAPASSEAVAAVEDTEETAVEAAPVDLGTAAAAEVSDGDDDGPQDEVPSAAMTPAPEEDANERVEEEKEKEEEKDEMQDDLMMHEHHATADENTQELDDVAQELADGQAPAVGAEEDSAAELSEPQAPAVVEDHSYTHEPAAAEQDETREPAAEETQQPADDEEVKTLEPSADEREDGEILMPAAEEVTTVEPAAEEGAAAAEEETEEPAAEEGQQPAADKREDGEVLMPAAEDVTTLEPAAEKVQEPAAEETQAAEEAQEPAAEETQEPAAEEGEISIPATEEEEKEAQAEQMPAEANAETENESSEPRAHVEEAETQASEQESVVQADVEPLGLLDEAASPQQQDHGDEEQAEAEQVQAEANIEAEKQSSEPQAHAQEADETQAETEQEPVESSQVHAEDADEAQAEAEQEPVVQADVEPLELSDEAASLQRQDDGDEVQVQVEQMPAEANAEAEKQSSEPQAHAEDADEAQVENLAEAEQEPVVQADVEPLELSDEAAPSQQQDDGDEEQAEAEQVQAEVNAETEKQSSEPQAHAEDADEAQAENLAETEQEPVVQADVEPLEPSDEAAPSQQQDDGEEEQTAAEDVAVLHEGPASEAKDESPAPLEEAQAASNEESAEAPGTPDSLEAEDAAAPETHAMDADQAADVETAASQESVELAEPADS